MTEDLDPAMRAELERICSKLNGKGVNCLLICAKAIMLKSEGGNTANREGMRQRLLILEDVWGISLRPERGLARRGELNADNLRTLDAALGIALPGY